MSGKVSTEEQKDTTWREVRHYAYVQRPFAGVAELLATAPERVVGRPGETTGPHEGLAGLHIHRAGVDLSRDVRITIGGVVLDEDAARLALHWEDAHQPKLFPVMEAVLELAPLTAGRHRVTQVGLVGRYRPPLGRLGAVADTWAGHRVVMESIAGFLENIADRIETEIQPPAVEPEAVQPSTAASRPAEPAAGGGVIPTSGRRPRRVFLPVDGLDRRQDGGTGLRQRLAAEPGVSRVELDAVAEMAVVDYDATVSSLGRLLAVLDEDSDVEPVSPPANG